ncbi:MAG: enoyl-CoA hydratase/isomerase family protein [Alphaproteobacteria bacterium]|nr:enoyl-CoA hydratase/isomerase family protein [Alphaproteobacteria bacterium]
MELMAPLMLDLPARVGGDAIAALLNTLAAARPGQPIVLRGGQEIFCGGLDFTYAATEGAALVDCIDLYARGLYMLRAHPGPCIAIVEGDAFGGGIALLAVCDYVVARRGVRFGLPEALYGFYPAIVFAALGERMAPALARQWALQCESIDAEAALKAGLIDEISDMPQNRLPRLLRRFGRALPEAVAAIRTHPAHLSAFKRALDDSASRKQVVLDRPEVRARLRGAIP